jgi:dihydrofolate reductase
MGKIVVSTNMTLDGVVQDPTGDEGFALGGWFEEMTDTARGMWAKLETEEALAASAMLFGARSYEWFASRWAGRTGVWAERLEALPKYVVSSHPIKTAWGPASTTGGGDPAVGVRSLKDTVDGEILVYGSGVLLETLFGQGLVDELRLFVFPTALGSGRRLFSGLGRRQRLALTRSSSLDGGIQHVAYTVVAGDPEFTRARPEDRRRPAPTSRTGSSH